MNKVCYKPTVGETLYRQTLKSYSRNLPDNEEEVVQCEVVSVGRKYFTVRDLGSKFERSFDIEYWLEKSEYSSDSVLYSTKQEYLDAQEYTQLEKNIRDLLHKNGLSKLSIEQIREINKILMGALV